MISKNTKILNWNYLLEIFLNLISQKNFITLYRAAFKTPNVGNSENLAHSNCDNGFGYIDQKYVQAVVGQKGGSYFYWDLKDNDLPNMEVNSAMKYVNI